MANRRRVILINPPFQLKFAFFVTSWVGALSLVTPLTVEGLYDLFIRIGMATPGGPQVEALKSSKDEVIRLLIATEFGLIVAIAALSLFLSHRIAGPLYKLKKTMEAAAHGDIQTHLTFRKADHFKELAETFNTMTTAWKARHAIALQALEASRAGAGPEQQKRIDEALAALRDIRP